MAQPAPAPPTTTTSESAATTTTISSSTSSRSSSRSESSGSGDETPISTQALFTGRGGRLSPARVRVPPFIAVTVVLHGADRRPYTLMVKGKRLSVGETRDQASLKLPGLRPGGRYVLSTGGGSPATLTIVANAEPGP